MFFTAGFSGRDDFARLFSFGFIGEDFGLTPRMWGDILRYLHGLETRYWRYSKYG
jgi:hypothetical protein